jgi:predicted nucleic acid-binding protein
LLNTGLAEPIRDVVADSGTDLHVPALCDVEIASGLRRAMLAGLVSEQRAREAVGDYLDLPLSRHGHRSLLGRVLELRSNFSAYDATYIALAEQLKAEVLTADARLARSVRAHTGIVIAT